GLGGRDPRQGRAEVSAAALDLMTTAAGRPEDALAIRGVARPTATLSGGAQTAEKRDDRADLVVGRLAGRHDAARHARANRREHAIISRATDVGRPQPGQIRAALPFRVGAVALGA